MRTMMMKENRGLAAIKNLLARARDNQIRSSGQAYDVYNK